MAVTIPGLAIKIDGDTSGFEQALKGVKGGIQSLLGPAAFTAISTGITAGLQVASKAFEGLQTAIGLAERGLAKFIATADKLGKMKDLAEQLNTGVGDLIGLNRGARRSGSNAESLQTAILAMRNTLGEAQSGGADPFGAIGLSLSSLSQMTSTGQLGAVFDALNKITDPTRRQAAGEDIFGKMYRSIELLSRGGSGGVRGLIEDAEKLGITFDSAFLDRVDRADDAVGDLRQQFDAIIDKVVGAFAPAIEKASNSMIEMLTRMSKDGTIDKWTANTEAMANFALDYANAINKATDPLGVRGQAEKGSLSSIFGPWLGGALDESSAAVQRSNKLDASIKDMQIKKQQEAAARANLPKSLNLGNWLGGGIGNLAGAGAGLGGFLGMQGNAALAGSQSWAEKIKERAGAPQFAGALEQGTAAAYAAAYQRDNKKTDEMVATNTKEAAKNTYDAVGWLKKIAENINPLKPATI